MKLAKRQARARRRAKSMRLRRRGVRNLLRRGDMLTASKFGWMSPWRAPYGLTLPEWQSAKKLARWPS